MTASTTDRRRRAAWLAAVVLLAAAPPAPAQRQGDDAVLRGMSRGARALAAGDDTTAARELDAVVGAIAAVWGTSPEAQRARSLWYEESVKPFKGDPYERMMAFYYRGLLYLRAGDFGNAQASFRQSIQQDAFNEEAQHRQDVALPQYLLGWALHAQGSIGSAREAYAVAHQFRPALAVPDVAQPLPNVLLVVETGTAPRKRVDGVGSFRLRYFRGREFTETSVRATVDGMPPVALTLAEDVFWQASTRGGRPADEWNAGKARFAAAAGNAGTAIGAVSAELTGQRYANPTASPGSGAAADAAGIISIGALIFSARAKPAADARYWDNLPDAVHLTTLSLPPGPRTIALQFDDAHGHALPELARSITIDVPEPGGRPLVVWATSRPRESSYLSKETRR